MKIRKGKLSYSITDIVNKIAAKTKCPKQIIRIILNAFFVVFEETLVNDEQLQIPLIGRFYRQTNPAHWRKLPTGEQIWVEDTHYVLLKHVLTFKKSLNRHKYKKNS